MKSPLQFSDYVAFLGDELERRRSSNARYPRSAFARDLGIPGTLLGDVLSGKRGLSREQACDVAKSLEFDDSDSAQFVDLVVAKVSQSQSEIRAALGRIDERRREVHYRLIEDDQSRFISDWYHLANVGRSVFTRDPAA